MITNKQRAQFLEYALTLADHVIDGKPSFALEGFFIDKHTFDGVTKDDLHDLIFDWINCIRFEEESHFEHMLGRSIHLDLNEDEDEVPVDREIVTT